MYAIRITIGSLLIAAICGICFLEYIWQTAYPTQIVISLMILAGLREFYALVAKRGFQPYTHLALLLVAVGLLWKVGGKDLLTAPSQEWHSLVMAMLAPVLLLAIMVRFLVRPEEKALENTALTLLGMVYVAYLMSFLLDIRMLAFGEPSALGGLFLLFFTILVSKSMDIGGYLVGKKFGKHKISPNISPKKSYEGFAGGMMLALVVGMLLVNNSHIWQVAAGKSLQTWEVLVLSAALALFSFFGDLAESLLKRRVDVKDSGQILPEFGGVLDMIDSLLFTAPVAYVLLLIFLHN